MGFAQRARKLTLGLSATLRVLSKGKAQVVILASDLAPNSKSEIAAAAQAAKVPVYVIAEKNAFGKLFDRREVGIIGVVDANFAKAVREIISQK